MPSNATTGQAAIEQGAATDGSGPVRAGLAHEAARPNGRTSLTRDGTRPPNSWSMARVMSARYGSSAPVPVRWKLTETPDSRMRCRARNTSARATSRSWCTSRLAEKWSTWAIARRIAGGISLERAKNMPLSTAVRDPARRARKLSSPASVGRSSGSPPVSMTTSGRFSSVNEPTNRSSCPASGSSRTVRSDPVEQCPHRRGQRRVRPSSRPAAGKGRSPTSSASSIRAASFGGWGRVRTSGAGARPPRLWRTGSPAVCHRFGGGMGAGQRGSGGRRAAPGHGSGAVELAPYRRHTGAEASPRPALLTFSATAGNGPPPETAVRIRGFRAQQ
ncbi:hypothetical protein SMICM17S_11993 [Streptomyces microflavus]